MKVWVTKEQSTDYYLLDFNPGLLEPGEYFEVEVSDAFWVGYLEYESKREYFQSKLHRLIIPKCE